MKGGGNFLSNINLPEEERGVPEEEKGANVESLNKSGIKDKNVSTYNILQERDKPKRGFTPVSMEDSRRKKRSRTSSPQGDQYTQHDIKAYENAKRAGLTFGGRRKTKKRRLSRSRRKSRRKSKPQRRLSRKKHKNI